MNRTLAYLEEYKSEPKMTGVIKRIFTSHAASRNIVNLKYGAVGK
ncbi:hypothetical protein [Petralouisia muris]|jgi:hypothetical protein|nr:hypothetical protein [Petralouisia muris]